ncbi:UBP-type zinc finger domain-containing protein [Nocardioides sp.]|uniref:UBP-type zinc finger domain-containing protein n=1 Tax=Nocardioides sp. TaxID=35761 RepID=UPI00352763B8
MSTWPPERSCAHLDQAYRPAAPGSAGCVDCEAIDASWVHLRVCQACGHVGCCDSSPHRHATAHARGTDHPLIRSFEPGEGWYFCYADNVDFELADAPAAPSHP